MDVWTYHDLSMYVYLWIHGLMYFGMYVCIYICIQYIYIFIYGFVDLCIMCDILESEVCMLCVDMHIPELQKATEAT